MNKDQEKYLNWMLKIIGGNNFPEENSYKQLFEHLYNTEFLYSIERDSNRASDGIDLRYRYSHEYGLLYSELPCSLLEMMVALAIRCEESIMDDPRYGDRTAQWFWSMINSLGLSAMSDKYYNEKYVNRCIERLLNREYSPNGHGGLFTVRNCDIDLRDVEIWYQMSYYLHAFIDD